MIWCIADKHSLVSMTVADGLVPISRQDFGKCRDDTETEE